jgi:hypothetical protein
MFSSVIPPPNTSHVKTAPTVTVLGGPGLDDTEDQWTGREAIVSSPHV